MSNRMRAGEVHFGLLFDAVTERATLTTMLHRASNGRSGFIAAVLMLAFMRVVQWSQTCASNVRKSYEKMDYLCFSEADEPTASTV